MKSNPWARFPLCARGATGYATAVVAVVAAAVAYALLPGLTTTPSALFMLAIAAVAAATNYGPALLAASLSGLAMNYLVLRPEQAFPAQPATFGAIAMFFVVALTVAWVGNKRQVAEHAQHESEELLKAFHENSLDGFMVFKAIRDQGQIVDFEYTYANPSALRMIGNERILGRRLLELYPTHAGPGGLFESYVRVVETGEPHDLEFFYEGEGIRGWFRNMSVKMGDGVAMIFSEITARKETEEAQRLNEQRFRAIFDRAGVGIVEVANDDHFIAVNDRACEILGYPRETLLAMNVHELTWPEDRPLSDRVNARIHEGAQDRIEYEKRYRKADGSPVWAHVTVSAVRDGQGNWIRSITTIMDITERLQAQDALRASEERYRMLFNEIDEGFCVVEVIFSEDHVPVDYRLLEINPSFERVTGLRNASGKTMRSLAPNHEQHWFDTYGNVALTGQPVRFQSSAAQVGRWYDVYAFRFGRPEERQVAILFNDITERKRTEEALRTNEARLRAVFNALVEGVVFLNPDGQVEEVNEAVPRAHGHTLAELATEESDPRQRIIRPDGTPFPVEEQPAIVALRSGKAVRDVEMGVPTQNGEIRWRLVNAQPVCDDRGNLLGAVASFYDITDRKRAEEALRTFTQELEMRVAERTEELEHTYQALRQSERLATLGQAMAILSHENRNALQNCLAALQMLRRTLGQNDRQQHYVDLALNALEGLRHAYEDVRQYAAPMKLAKEPASMEALWRATWANMASSTAGRDVRLVESCSHHGMSCEVDHARFQQVFRNLIENSLDACPDPVEIRISCEHATIKERPALRITVCDNGPGMSRTESQRVMEPFFTTKSKGTGVGLAVVRRIIEAHGGRIAIDTEEGQGFGVVMEVPKSDN